MSVLHLKTDTIADFTGTVTVYDQLGITQTVAATDLVRPSDWNSQHAIQMTLAGNTVGASTVSGSNIIFEGGNNVTLSGNGDTIVFVGGAGAGGIGLAAGTRTATTANTVLFDNANGITFGLNAVGGSVMTASHNALTTARASNDAIGLNTALTANGVSVTANSSGLSLNFPAFLTTAALSNHSHGNPQLNLTNLSGTTASNSAGFTLSLSANGAAAGVGIEAGTRTATTAGNIRFETGNGITFGLDAIGGSVMTASHNALTTARASNDAIGLNTALTANGVSVTANSSGLSLNFPAFLTTAALSNHSHGNPTLNLTNLSGTTASNSAGFTLSLSAGNYLTTARASNDAVGLNTAQTNVTWTVNSSGISFNAGGYAGTGFTSTTTAGTDVKATVNTAGVSMAVPAFLTAAGGGGTALTMYATSNTTLSSTITAPMSSMIFAGAGAISVGVSNGSVVISGNAAAGDGVNIVSMLTSTSGGGTAGATYSNSTGSIGLMAGSNITLSQTSNTIVFNAPNSSSIVGISGISISTNGNTISFMESPQSSWVSPDMALSVIGAMGNGSFSIAYRDVNIPVTATRVDCPFYWSQASSAAANTVAIAMTVLCGIYTRNVSTLNTVSSASTQTTYTLASNTAGITAFSVARNLPISLPMNINMSRGNYYFGFGISTTFSSIGTATTTAAQTISAIGVPQGSSAVPWVGNITQASNTSVGMFSGHGIYSAAVASVVPAISLSAINQSGSYFHRANIALVFRN